MSKRRMRREIVVCQIKEHAIKLKLMALNWRNSNFFGGDKCKQRKKGEKCFSFVKGGDKHAFEMLRHIIITAADMSRRR